MNQTNFEFNNHAVYLRNRDLSLHYKALHEINSRKNIFSDLSKKTKKDKTKGNKRVRMSLDRQYVIDKDNNYLVQKLYQISNKEVIKPKLKTSKSHDMNRHFINVQTVKRMKEKNIEEENFHMLKRLQEGEPVMNIDKLEDNYKNHLKFKKLIKKVGSGFNKLYKENELPPIDSKKPSKTQYKQMKSSFSSADQLKLYPYYVTGYDERGYNMKNNNGMLSKDKMGSFGVNLYEGFQRSSD